MDKIKVHLRIVGLFFSKTVEVESKAGLTIKDVLDAYIKANPIESENGLSYVASMEGPPNEKVLSILSFTHNFDGSYVEKGKSDDCFKTIGGKIRQKGLYRLQELVLDPVVVAWQSYLIDSNTGRNKTKTLPGEGFTTFNGFRKGVSVNINIQDGDTIIWRMVAIARSPNVFPATTTCKKGDAGYSLSE